MSVCAKLISGGTILLGVTVYVAFLGASTSWQYYLTVDECMADLSRFSGSELRINGRVAPGTLHLRNDGASARFVLEGTSGRLPTTCSGPLPDNLAEGMLVVVEGRLSEGGSLEADKVLTRCASKYESRH